jgi:hypothetical protein
MPDGYVDQSYLCVSMEQINFTPISMDEVLKIMSKQLIAKLTLPKDHHEKRV